MGGFSILSLLYVAMGARVLWMMAQNWRGVWDRNFTGQDRMLVNQASFFFLVPISVILHELGHAVMVWSYGKEVVDWGFYGFAGYVAFYPYGLTDVQQTIIAAAGTFVNLVLCLLALAVVLYWKPPLRASINELLIGFIFISGLNAFVVYPLLDLVSGMNGDWRQMYDSGVPWLTTIIVIVQVAVLAGGYWLFTNPGMKARFARLTDVPPGFERGMFGGIQPAKIKTMNMDPNEIHLRDAVNRVASGWHTRVDSQVQRFQGGSAILVQWTTNREMHVAAVRSLQAGSFDIVEIPTNQQGSQDGRPRIIQRWNRKPGIEELTIALRMAMEQIDLGA
ncbi:MAG: hypothetical protein M9950_04915 [Thermomicrobiales bacterium]|nr:hypothetical protein [Thermomicrobiales bacterium]